MNRTLMGNAKNSGEGGGSSLAVGWIVLIVFGVFLVVAIAVFVGVVIGSKNDKIRSLFPWARTPKWFPLNTSIADAEEDG